MSLLLLWRAEGMSLEVLPASSRRSAYWTHAGRFDLLPARASVEVTKVERVVHPIVVGIPPCWVASLLPQHVRPFSLEHPRLQFNDRPLERLLGSLLNHHASNEPLGRLYTQSLSTVLAHRLLTPDCDRVPGAGRRDVLPCIVRRKVVELIDANLDAPPDLASLAALAGQGTLAFLRSFKATLGHTLHQYVLHRRIDRAKLLLASPSRALTSVALELGFASHAHFTTVFRMHTGFTPSEYRDARRGRSSQADRAVA